MLTIMGFASSYLGYTGICRSYFFIVLFLCPNAAVATACFLLSVIAMTTVVACDSPATLFPGRYPDIISLATLPWGECTAQADLDYDTCDCSVLFPQFSVGPCHKDLKDVCHNEFGPRLTEMTASF